MRRIKNKTSLFKRVPMTGDLLLGEFIYLIPVGIIVYIVADDKPQAVLGFVVGGLLSVGMLIHMALSVEDSITMMEEEALKHTRKRYAIRMVILVVAFLAMFFLKTGNLITALVALMSLKVAAYIQPFTHKFIQKFNKEGR